MNRKLYQVYSTKELYLTNGDIRFVCVLSISKEQAIQAVYSKYFTVSDKDYMVAEEIDTKESLNQIIAVERCFFGY